MVHRDRELHGRQEGAERVFQLYSKPLGGAVKEPLTYGSQTQQKSAPSCRDIHSGVRLVCPVAGGTRVEFSGGKRPDMHFMDLQSLFVLFTLFISFVLYLLHWDNKKMFARFEQSCFT